MGPQILVVEDNEKNRVLVKDVLCYFGYEVLEATDGLEGIAMALEHRPGLILMDLQMPVLSGLDAMKRLREHPETKETKIIAVTSFAMKGDREKLLDAGFDGYIAKPLDPIELPEIVKKYLS
ncbi:MAG: response regulator [Deltaproteobacteria bacterium]|nr:response regulator [Deltaproteobacteria bacterium]